MSVASLLTSAEAHNPCIDSVWRGARAGQRIPVIAPCDWSAYRRDRRRLSRLTPGQRSDILMRFGRADGGGGRRPGADEEPQCGQTNHNGARLRCHLLD